MTVQYHKLLKKQYKSLSEKMKNNLKQKLHLFRSNTFHPLLNNHSLQGKWKNHRSINITGDYRAIYKEISEEESLFVRIGIHSQLYK